MITYNITPRDTKGFSTSRGRIIERAVRAILIKKTVLTTGIIESTDNAISRDANGKSTTGGKRIIQSRVDAIIINKSMPDGVSITIITDNISTRNTRGNCSWSSCEGII